MDETFIYQQIAESIRQDLREGKLQMGDRLPPIRDMAQDWDCTIGTVQRAYKELAGQGLIISRIGSGTRISENLSMDEDIPLRKAALIHRAEAFLLEILTCGYHLDEVEQAVRLAMDHWRTIQAAPPETTQNVLRFAGSHDMAVAWLSSHFDEIAPGYKLQLGFSGSLNGLIALAEGKVDLAGSHLWDAENDTYNLEYIKRLFPGKRIGLVTLAHRRLGLIIPPGNPYQVHGLEDLARPELIFVNRQSGSGTRVWLDSKLHEIGISVNQIKGYSDERLTHSDVALAIANQEAQLGLGMQAFARAYGLDFIHLTQERYDLVFLELCYELPPIRALIDWLRGEQARLAISEMTGYETYETGHLRWVG